MGKYVAFLFALVSFVQLALASGVVTNVTLRQLQPWDGLVEIGYDLTEDVVAPEGEGLATKIKVCDLDGGLDYAPKALHGTPSYTAGHHRLVWHAAKEGVAFASSNVIANVTVKLAPRYCVIDLSGGTGAASYPVSYLNDIPAGGWTDEYKTTKLVLRNIAPGAFTMGSPTDEVGRFSGETQHEVTLTTGFWIGVFEVTQKQYQLVMGSTPSYYNGDMRPVEGVSYNTIRGSSSGAGWPGSSAVDATSFMGRIRAKTGVAGFDLPTEAQWEYACRAGTTTALNSGKDLTSTTRDANMNEVGRYGYNNGHQGGSKDGKGGYSSNHTTVGSYQPNAWGLYDMHGNVYEWCLDWYGSYSSSAASDPKGATSGSSRVQRGGSWGGHAQYCRSAIRDNGTPSGANGNYGFRLCCSAGLAR